MGLRIHTNVTSLAARRHLGRSTQDAQVRSGRLASGQRIRGAADDPAGLGVSERMRARERSSVVAERGIADGLSLLRVADGILERVADIAQRTRELAMQAASGLLSDEERALLDGERASLAEESELLIDEADYNGLPLFPEQDPTFDIKVGTGATASDVLTLDFDQVERIPRSLETISIASEAGAQSALRATDLVIDFISERRGEIGASQNRLESALHALDTRGENLAASGSRLRDADLALETAAWVKARMLQEGGSSVLAQANTQPSVALRLLEP